MAWDDELKENVAYGDSTPRDLGQVQQQINRLNEIVERLFKDQTILEERLVPILGPPHVDKPMDEDSPELVPLAANLYNITETLTRLHYRMMELGDRITI